MSWTDERVAILTKLWADGLSASQIAAELNQPDPTLKVSRNAVIGKVHRLGLSGRVKPANSSAKRKKRAPKVAGSTTGTRTRQTRARGTSYSAAPQPIIEDIPVPECLKMNLVELTDQTCRWPHGDPTDGDFHFCGNNVKEDTPYCKYHARMAFQPSSERRRPRQQQPRAIAG